MYEHMTLKQASEALANKTLTSVELTQSYLDRIAEKDKAIHAYLEVFEAHALEQARASDARRMAGEVLSEIDGIPLAIKDNILVEGEHATGGSKILEGYVSPYDATVTQKLKAAGAVLFGRRGDRQSCVCQRRICRSAGSIRPPTQGWRAAHARRRIGCGRGAVERA